MFQLTTTALFLLSTFYGNLPAPAGANAGGQAGAPMEVLADERAKIDVYASPDTLVNQPFTLEEYARDYFADTPVLAEIAKCESRFRHLSKNGEVLRGEVAIEDLGIMQINEFYHEERAKKLGFNLHTLDGNLAYAKWLYAKEGVAPWLSSGTCWQKSDTLAQMNPSEDSGGLAQTDTKAVTN